MKTIPNDQDNQIIEQLRAGSKEAFRSLFDAFGPKIHAFALSYLKNNADAEELLQEVFLKLWEVRASLDISKNIKSLLFKICINLIYDFIRRKNIEKAYLDYSVNNQLYSENTWNEVIYNDMLNTVNLLVAKMPEQRQRIFRLCKEEGLSNDEIAKQLNLSRRTIENQLYRAVSFLKEKLLTGSLPVFLFFFFHCK
ncbi:MAG: RNA polymerase sigma-70 factor [Mariniphaga sp.]|nr:RNA polymerase sigma-70 factor [Mariniphaga sp.]